MAGNTVISTMPRIMQTKKGRVTRAMRLLSMPVIFCSTNRLKPTGGVISAISISMMMKMPNHTRSKPAFCTMGNTTALVSTIMEMPSSAVPSTR